MLKKIIWWGVNSSFDEESNQRIRLHNIIALSLIGVAFPYFLIFTAIKVYLLAIIAFAVNLILILSLVLNRNSYYTFSRIVLQVCSVGAVFFYSAILGEKTNIHLFNYALVAVPMVIFSPKEKGWRGVCVGLPILSHCVLKFTNFSILGHIKLDSAYVSLLAWSISLFSFSIIIVSLQFLYKKFSETIYALNKEKQVALSQNEELLKEKLAHNGTVQALKKENKLSEALLGTNEILVKQLQTNLELIAKENDEKKKALDLAESEKAQKEAALEREKGYVVELEGKTKQLDQSLVVVEDVIKAGKLQQAIQPKGESQFVKLVFKNYAARHLAGDFGYWKDCGRKTLVVMGDVQGKGAVAGFVAGIVADRLGVFVDQQGEGVSLEALDTFFRVSIAKHPIMNRKAVALVAVLVDMEAGTLSYLNAGIHTQPILCRRDGGCVPLECSGMAYGMVDEALPVEVFKVEKGDRFLCMTDGVEDLKNRDGEAFGHERARVFCEGLTGLLLDDVVARMDDEIHGFKGEAEFVDDISVVVMDVVG